MSCEEKLALIRKKYDTLLKKFKEAETESDSDSSDNIVIRKKKQVIENDTKETPKKPSPKKAKTRSPSPAPSKPRSRSRSPHLQSLGQGLVRVRVHFHPKQSLPGRMFMLIIKVINFKRNPLILRELSFRGPRETHSNKRKSIWKVVNVFQRRL